MHLPQYHIWKIALIRDSQLLIALEKKRKRVNKTKKEESESQRIILKEKVTNNNKKGTGSEFPKHWMCVKLPCVPQF